MDVPEAKATLILVVDDDVRTARVLAKMLEDDGFDVELAVDGAAAIGRLGRQPAPDILVTDLRMPHADGLAVAQYARSLDHDLPIFFVTGYPQLAVSVDRELEPPAVVHVKPIDYATLSDQLRASVSADSSRSSGPPGAMRRRSSDAPT